MNELTTTEQLAKHYKQALKDLRQTYRRTFTGESEVKKPKPVTFPKPPRQRYEY